MELSRRIYACILMCIVAASATSFPSSSSTSTCVGESKTFLHDLKSQCLSRSLSLLSLFRATKDLSLISANVSPVFVQAPSEKGFASFAIDFLMGGVSMDYAHTRLANDAKGAKKGGCGR